jgi:ribokinase
MVPDPGANDAPIELPGDLLAPGDHLHVTGYSLLRPGSRAAALDAVARARDAGMTVSADPSSWALLSPGAIPAVDVLLPNEEEAAALAGDDAPERAARALAGRAAPEIVVTLGRGGALWTDGAEVVRVAAEPAEVVDTTGAGDAFAAGLLTARLAGAGPREALAAGCGAAAVAVARVGARPA